MLKGLGMTLGNRHAQKNFIDNGLTYIKWGARNVSSFHRGVSQKIVENTGLNV